MTPFAAEADGLRWRSALPRSLPRQQAQWLRKPGSLTRALKALGEVDVTVVREGVVTTARNRTAIGAVIRGAVWIRDVMLSVDGTDVIAARSVTSARHSRGDWKALRTLGARPLATLLYHDRSVTRSAFVYAPYHASRLYGARSAEHEAAMPESWGRSSVFRRRLAPLVVTELFLPAIWSEIEKWQCMQVD